MELFEFDLWQLLDMLLLLLIGMGPKVALVPFLDLTAGMDRETKKKVASRMVRTATVVVLMRLLHFTEPALYIAGGIVFLLVALRMLAEAGDESEDHQKKAAGRDTEKIALYPLAVPYLLNPAGATLLIVFSGALDSWLMLGIMVILVLLVAALDWLIFSNLDRFAKHLDKSRLAVTEAVFGVLLAALAVELVLTGLARLGIIDLVVH
jgi:small neutral amino acid transporter SnatA (MarC family)